MSKNGPRSGPQNCPAKMRGTSERASFTKRNSPIVGLFNDTKIMSLRYVEVELWMTEKCWKKQKNDTHGEDYSPFSNSMFERTNYYVPKQKPWTK